MLLLAVACGGSESASPSSPSTATAAAPTTGAPTATGTGPVRAVVPDVVLRDVGTGADVNLRALGLSDRPTLYWFWAPH